MRVLNEFDTVYQVCRNSGLYALRRSEPTAFGHIPVRSVEVWGLPPTASLGLNQGPSLPKACETAISGCLDIMTCVNLASTLSLQNAAGIQYLVIEEGSCRVLTLKL